MFLDFVEFGEADSSCIWIWKRSGGLSLVSTGSRDVGRRCSRAVAETSSRSKWFRPEIDEGHVAEGAHRGEIIFVRELKNEFCYIVIWFPMLCTNIEMTEILTVAHKFNLYFSFTPVTTIALPTTLTSRRRWTSWTSYHRPAPALKNLKRRNKICGSKSGRGRCSGISGPTWEPTTRSTSSLKQCFSNW